MPQSWMLKLIPYLDDLVTALRAGEYKMAGKIVLTMVVYAAIASGLVVLAGCGQISYDSAGKPQYNRTEITRTDVVKPNDFEVAPGK